LEHDPHASADFADQPAKRAFATLAKVEDTVRDATVSHLVVEACHDDIVACRAQ
jgi:hypothetical protein